MGTRISIDYLTGMVTRAFIANGVSDHNARIIAGVVVMAERDGCRSHGVFRMPGYITSLRSGWLDGKALPKIVDSGASAIRADARNGFMQVAMDAARPLLIEKARAHGTAALGMTNGHHFAALWPDVEILADAGLVAITFVNGRSGIAPWTAKRKIFGTNPMAFACPRKSGAPLVWDQASSVVARGEVLLASRDGKTLREGIGIDFAGNPTTDPKAVLAGGALLPFGGYKGSSIAAMVEIMAAAVSGGEFGIEDRSVGVAGAETPRSNQFVIAIDPRRFAGDGFLERVEFLLSNIISAGAERLPGDRRRTARRKSVQEGIELDQKTHDYLLEMVSDVPTNN